MRKIIPILIVLGLIAGIVSISGCTDSGAQSSTPAYKNDIEVGAATYDYYSQDGSASGGCDVINNGNVTYKKVKIELDIYDKDGNLVGNETKSIGQLKPGEELGYFVVTEKAIPKGKSASATVINATPA